MRSRSARSRCPCSRTRCACSTPPPTTSFPRRRESRATRTALSSVILGAPLEWSPTLPHRGEGSEAYSHRELAKLGRRVTRARSGLLSPCLYPSIPPLRHSRVRGNPGASMGWSPAGAGMICNMTFHLCLQGGRTAIKMHNTLSSAKLQPALQSTWRCSFQARLRPAADMICIANSCNKISYYKTTGAR